MKSQITWADNRSLTVVGFLGGPGVGKSLTAAEVFPQLKRQQILVELIPEAAKGFVWDGWDTILSEQDYIFASQHRLQRRLVNHGMEYCLSDSSLLLGMIYMPDDLPPSFGRYVRDVYDSYDNINIFMERNLDYPYQTEGRSQTLAEAQAVDAKIKKYLNDTNTPYHTVKAGESATAEVVNIILEHHYNRNRK